MAKKRHRKNHYKNSGELRRQRLAGLCLCGLKIMLIAAGMMGTSLLLIFVYDLATQSSYFEAETITVEGNQRVSSEVILKQAGLRLRDNILSVNLNAVRHKVMANAWIAAAEVERELPGAIHIRVRERVPVAIVQLNRPYYLDEDGEIFKPVEPRDIPRIPVVTGLPVSEIDFSDPWRSRHFAAVMEVLQSSLEGNNVIPLGTLRRINVDTEMGLTLHVSFPSRNMPDDSLSAADHEAATGRGDNAGLNVVAIRVGFGDYESKCDRLGRMVALLNRENRLLNPVFIDLNDYDRIVVRHSPAGKSEGPSVSDSIGEEV